MKKWLCGGCFVLLCMLLPLRVQAQPETAHKQVTVVHHGELLCAQSREETVGQLLQRLGIVLADGDCVTHSMEAPVNPGMTIRIDSVLTRMEEYTVTVPYDVQNCQDPMLPEGGWEVVLPGREGELSCRAEVTYVNGREVRREILSQIQTAPPVTEVIAWGTGPAEEADPERNPDLPVIEDGYIRLATGEVLTYTGTATVRASAYTHTDAGCDMFTSTGSRVHVGTVAVDPRYIPYGTRMFIMARSGSYVYGVSEAEDCGGAIKGDRVDLYLPTYEECMEFGRRVCTVYYLG